MESAPGYSLSPADPSKSLSSTPIMTASTAEPSQSQTKPRVPRPPLEVFPDDELVPKVSLAVLRMHIIEAHYRRTFESSQATTAVPSRVVGKHSHDTSLPSSTTCALTSVAALVRCPKKDCSLEFWAPNTLETHWNVMHNDNYLVQNCFVPACSFARQEHCAVLEHLVTDHGIVITVGQTRDRTVIARRQVNCRDWCHERGFPPPAPGFFYPDQPGNRHRPSQACKDKQPAVDLEIQKSQQNGMAQIPPSFVPAVNRPPSFGKLVQVPRQQPIIRDFCAIAAKATPAATAKRSTTAIRVSQDQQHLSCPERFGAHSSILIDVSSSAADTESTEFRSAFSSK